MNQYYQQILNLFNTNKTLRLFVETIIDNENEKNYILQDLQEALNQDYNLNTLDDIKKYYSNSAKFYFVAYAIDQKFAQNLFDKINYLLEI
jgi:hypothetical protein